MDRAFCPLNVTERDLLSEKLKLVLGLCLSWHKSDVNFECECKICTNLTIVKIWRASRDIILCSYIAFHRYKRGQKFKCLCSWCGGVHYAFI